MQRFRFNQLNKKAQLTAIKNYISGWIETHSEDLFELTHASVKECLSTDLLNEIEYNEKGFTSYEEQQNA